MGSYLLSLHMTLSLFGTELATTGNRAATTKKSTRPKSPAKDLGFKKIKINK